MWEGAWDHAARVSDCSPRLGSIWARGACCPLEGTGPLPHHPAPPTRAASRLRCGIDGLPGEFVRKRRRGALLQRRALSSVVWERFS